MTNTAEAFETLGVGLLYRPELEALLNTCPAKVDYVEILTESIFDKEHLAHALVLGDRFPLLCHGLELSLGTDQQPDKHYLEEVSGMLATLNPRWISDHIALTRIDGVSIGRLAPVRFSEEQAAVMARNFALAERALGRPLLLENIAYYFTFPGSELDEAAFVAELLHRSGASMLLDLNNLFVNACNHHYDPYRFLDAIPLHRVVEIHIAGCAWRGLICVDTHGHTVASEVWHMLEWVCARVPIRAITLERDQNLDDIYEIGKELERAKYIWSHRTHVY